MARTELDTITDPKGRHRLVFYRDERGFFRFEEWLWDEEDLVELGLSIWSDWVPLGDSGLYSSLEEAKRGALEVGWYRAMQSEE